MKNFIVFILSNIHNFKKTVNFLIAEDSRLLNLEHYHKKTYTETSIHCNLNLAT